MQDALIYARGYFWWAREAVPNGKFAPDGAITGALEVSADGRTSLKLDATLPRDSRDGPLAAILNRGQVEQPICGILADGVQHVWLTEPVQSGVQVSSRGPSSEGFLARSCLISPKPFYPNIGHKFSSVELSLEGYEEWLNLPLIHVTRTRRSFTARFALPRKREWKLDRGKLSLECGLQHHPSGWRSAISVTQQPRLRLSAAHQMDLEKALELAVRLDDLILLLTDSERGLGFPTLRGRRFKSPIRAYYPRRERSREQVYWGDFCTGFPQIADAFGSIVDSWLSKHETFGPGFHLYLGNRRGVQLYPEHRFASLVWGLESFHRQAFPLKRNAALEEKINRIIGQVSHPKDQKWLKGRLKMAGEPSLAERLAVMLDALPVGLHRKELHTFTTRCADRRNDLSHYGGMRDTGGYDDFLTDITDLNRAMDFLYHAKLLQEIGIPDNQICWWFLSGPRSYNIRQNLAAVGLKLPTV